MRVIVTYTRTGYTFTADVDQHGCAANGTLSLVHVNPDGTVTHVGSGMKLDPGPCGTWAPVAGGV